MKAYNEIDLSLDVLVDVMRGRAGGLRPSKPSKNGLHQYIWRMCRFHSGKDVTMPIMCIYDLERWLKENDYDYSVCFKPTPEAQAFMKTLDTVIDQILDKLKESKYGGAIAWAKVI